MNTTSEHTRSEHTRETACALLNAPWIYRNHMGIVFLRLCVAGMMLTHGYPKLVMLLRGQSDTWLDPLGIGSTLSLSLCVFAEFFCSLALMAGFLTRMAALVLIINFWVVVFVVDRDATWSATELPLLYLVCYITLLCSGAGRFSVDHLLQRKLPCHYPDAPGEAA